MTARDTGIAAFLDRLGGLLHEHQQRRPVGSGTCSASSRATGTGIPESTLENGADCRWALMIGRRGRSPYCRSAGRRRPGRCRRPPRRCPPAPEGKARRRRLGQRQAQLTRPGLRHSAPPVAGHRAQPPTATLVARRPGQDPTPVSAAIACTRSTTSASRSGSSRTGVSVHGNTAMGHDSCHRARPLRSCSRACRQ